MPSFPKLTPEKYVIYARKHFSGFRVFEDGGWRLQMNHKTHVGLDSPNLRPSSIEAVFKLIPFASHVAKPSADVSGGARPISLAQIFLHARGRACLSAAGLSS